jgi:hypothetical protein
MTQKKVLSLWLSLSLLTTVGVAQTVTTSGGSGGTVPSFTGSTVIANSPIYVTGTTNAASVGIGIVAPSQKLEVYGNARTDGAFMTYGTGGYVGQQLFLYNQAKYNQPGVGYMWAIDNMTNNGQSGSGFQGYVNSLQFWAYDSAMCGSGSVLCASRLTLEDNGNVGISTNTPGATPPAGYVAGTAIFEVNGDIVLTQGKNLFITFPDGSEQTTAYTGINCGGDYAEAVDVTGDRASFAPGDVLVINPNVAGKFLKSAEPYSTLVAGIYSTKPGTVGRRQTTPKNPDEVPMALVGIVPTKVSAENGSIQAGDLLVSASTIGYAMKGTDRERMLGAVIGKALGSLDSGTGVIEVLVTLR